jgi:hypothetical protein
MEQPDLPKLDEAFGGGGAPQPSYKMTGETGSYRCGGKGGAGREAGGGGR